MSYTIRPTTIPELTGAPNFQALIEEYCLESGIPELGRANAQLQTYRALEDNGALKTIAAYVGEHQDELVGFVCVLVHVLPHFGCRVGISESLFLAQAARHTGAGLGLMKAAEAVALENQAEAFLLSAPAGSRLGVVAQGVGYRLTNETYFKALAPQH